MSCQLIKKWVVRSQPSLSDFPSIQPLVRQEDSPELIPFQIKVELEQNQHGWNLIQIIEMLMNQSQRKLH